MPCPNIEIKGKMKEIAQLVQEMGVSIGSRRRGMFSALVEKKHLDDKVGGKELIVSLRLDAATDVESQGLGLWEDE